MYGKLRQRYEDDCVFETKAFDGGSVMVWAGISIGGRTDLVFIDGNLDSRRYIDEVLRPHVLSYLAAIGNGAIFQDDNVRPHRGKNVVDFLEENGVEHMEWPAISPDMSAIEHLWDILEREI